MQSDHINNKVFVGMEAS